MYRLKVSGMVRTFFTRATSQSHPEALERGEQPVPRAPDDEGEVCAVPQAAEDKDHGLVKRRAPFSKGLQSPTRPDGADLSGITAAGRG